LCSVGEEKSRYLSRPDAAIETPAEGEEELESIPMYNLAARTTAEPKTTSSLRYPLYVASK